MTDEETRAYRRGVIAGIELRQDYMMSDADEEEVWNDWMKRLDEWARLEPTNGAQFQHPPEPECEVVSNFYDDDDEEFDDDDDL